MRALLHLESRWQTLGIPFALTPIGQFHQSPPSPVAGDRGRGKRRGFSLAVAARHLHYTRVHTDFDFDYIYLIFFSM